MSSMQQWNRRVANWPSGVACLVGLYVVALSAHPVRAGLVIVPTFDSTITSDANAATIISTINSAIQVYQTRFSDSVTVAITFQEMATGLGQSSTFVGSVTYSQYRAALVADRRTTFDATALAYLPTGSTNPVNGNANVAVTTANLRALGFNANPPAGQPDGTISLNTSLMNLSRPPSNGSKYDLFAVAAHEIDEVLGFGSLLNGMPNSPIVTPSGAVWGMDLFRYDPLNNRSLTTDPNAVAFFSINGGATHAARFNQSASGDFSDWFSTGAHVPQVQDAFATAGAAPDLAVELTGLDVLGYNLVAVPEPGAGCLMGVATMIFLSCSCRVHRRQA